MLKTLSKLERTRGLIIILFVFVMAASLVFFYAPGGNNPNAALNQSTESLAKVGGDYVTVGDVVSQRENLARISPQYAMIFNEERILEQMIRSKVTAQEAERLGLTASDTEVRDEIRDRFKGTDGQFIGWDKYQQNIKANYGDVEKYEQSVRDSLSAQKLEALITAGVTVSEQEIQDNFKRQNTTFELSYISVSANKLAENIKPSDDELKAYFEAHKKEYYISVPQKKIRYLFIEQSKVGEKLSVSDQELKEAYDKLSPEQKQAGVKVQQIVLRVAHEKLKDAVKKKADELAQKAKGETGSATEQAFADLAKGSSEDPATAKNGGWINGLVRKNPNNPSDLLQQTLEQQPGAVIGPIEYRNAFYIFRRGEAVDKTIEQAKKELEVSARNRKAYAAAAQLAQKAQEKVKESKDIQKVAQELAGEANMSPANMVKETPFVKTGDDVPNIGNSDQFWDGIKDLNNPNDVGNVTPIKNGFAIPMLVEKKDPRDAELDEVKDRVTQAVKNEKAKAQLEQTAKDIASAVKSPADMKAAAEKYGLKVSEAKDYKLGATLGEAGADQTTSTSLLENTIYDLKEGDVTKEAIKSGDNYVIVAATKRKDADMAEYEKQKDQLKQNALQQEKSKIFSDYIQNIVDRMKKEKSIVIYKEVLARISQKDETGLPNFPGGGQLPIQQ